MTESAKDEEMKPRAPLPWVRELDNTASPMRRCRLIRSTDGLVVAYDVGGIPEVIENGVDGYLVPARDVAAAGRCAIDILSRADRGREMGIRARQNAERKYSSRDVIPHYENYYRQVLNAATAARA